MAALRFDTHLSGARENLTSDKKRQNAGNNSIPRDVTAHQIIVVTAVTVAGKIRIVFVKPDFVAGRQLLISTPGALRKNALASFVLCYDLAKGCALRRGIFGMRVIVIKARAV